MRHALLQAAAVATFIWASAAACAPVASPGQGEPVPTSTDPGEQTQGAPVGTPATPAATLTESQLATRTSHRERMEWGRHVLNAFQEADTGRWDIGRDPRSDEFLSVSLRSIGDYGRTTVRVWCDFVDGSLLLKFDGRDGRERPTRTAFHDEVGAELRSLKWPATTDPNVREFSRQVADGMLLPGVSEMRVNLISGPRWERVDRVFDVSGFPAVYEVLMGYCQPSPDEIQATTAAMALKAPTPTPVPSPTFTPAYTTWQREWCRERANKSSSYNGHYGTEYDGSGTVRLIVRCEGGALVMGLHVTRADAGYPEDGSGVAYLITNHRTGRPSYKYMEEGWEQVRSDDPREGIFLVLPEPVARDVADAMTRPTPENRRFRVLQVLVNVAPGDPRLEIPGEYDVGVYVRGAGRQRPFGEEPEASTRTRPFTPVPTRLRPPTATPAPPPTHTPIPVPTPNVELLSESPLTATFLEVPASHNGVDAVQFRLLFTEPVSISYRTLRDVAIHVENGTVRESKRVDGRSDLWAVTVEPDEAEDMAITLTAPADCGDADAVCTGSGKVLSNSPVVRVPYGDQGR